MKGLTNREFSRFAATATVLAALLLVSCTSAPRYRSGGGGDTPVGEASDVVTYAKSFLGTPYQTGGTSRNGMDCSGLVSTVYNEFNVVLPRTAQDQSQVGSDVSRNGVKPGDLVFFQTSRSKPVSHVGIYVGDGRFIHASTSAREVRIDEMNSDYFRRRFVKAKRVL